jgi:hypothetical protein
MSDAWDRLLTEMIRQMIRESLSHAGEFLTFNRLAYLIRAHSDLPADSDLVHIVAEQRQDLFKVSEDDRRLKLYTEAVQRIVEEGVEHTVAEVGPLPASAPAKREPGHCDHFASENEILSDLSRCSFRPETLTRSCCWSEINRVRGLNPGTNDQEAWRELCRVRGYLHARQNPRGF